MALLDRDPHPFSSLWNLIKSIYSWVANFFSTYFNVIDITETRIQTIVSKAEALVLNARNEIDSIRNFEFNPKWNQRVIHVPTALDRTRSLLVGDSSVPHDLINKVNELVLALKAVWGDFKAAERQKTFTDTNAIQKGSDQAIAILNQITHTFDAIETFIDNLQQIVDDITALRQEFESLDTIFLQQGNSRKHLKKNSLVRVGALHE